MKDDTNFEKTRRKNDAKLLARLEPIRAGEDTNTLASFAKAYLGLYMEIAGGLDPVARVRVLANAPLGNAVLEGFVSFLYRDDLPTPDAIGEALSRGQLDNLGYVVLAGVDLVADRTLDAALALPEPALQSALCFHLSQGSTGQAAWARQLLVHRPDIAVSALQGFWAPLVSRGVANLPGLPQVLAEPALAPLATRVLPALLRAWKRCPRPVLRELLQTALRLMPAVQLMEVVRESVQQDEPGDVASRVYWLATGFLLSPAEFGDALADYTGRSRDKVLPLLDFNARVLLDPDTAVRLTPMAVAHLLRLIAPQFRRNEHAMGGLDATSQKVMHLFELLARDTSGEAGEALRALRKVRMMGRYADVLDQVEQAQQGRLDSMLVRSP